MSTVIKNVIGVILFILGVCCGIYFGIIWGFIGGIIQFINGVTPEINAINIAWGVARVFILSPILGWVSFIALTSIGCSLIKT